MADIKDAEQNWKENRLKNDLETVGEIKKDFKTNSGISVNRLYTPLDLEGRDWSYVEKLGFPGEYPYIRGITGNMYRGERPRAFVYSGYGSAEDTNKRYKHLISEGAKEIIIASHLPTQMGYDSDNPLARGEVGKIGVAIDSLADMEIIFEGIPIGEVFVGAQTNANSIVMLAMIIAAAEKQGVAPEDLKIVIQNDVLKEYFARGTYIFPPRHGLKLSCDCVEYVVRNIPSNFIVPIIYCGYHIRETGGNAVQEIAFTLSNAVSYLDELVRRGVSIDDLPAPRGLFVAGMDLFEEISKHRAFRRMWAKVMKERYHATNPNVMAMTYTSGSQASLYTAQQPMNNIVRGTIQALVQALSGVQTMSVAAMDEALSIPTEESSTLALRTVQIVSDESGVMNTVDPLGGSYFVEALTDKLEEEAFELFNRLEVLGGAITGIEQGFQESELMKTAYEQYRQEMNGGRVVIGVNKHQTEEDISIDIMKVDPVMEKRQIEKIEILRKERDNQKVKIALRDIKEAAKEDVNLIPQVLDAVKVYATGGEIIDELREVYGVYERPIYIRGS
ncbi:methylmalonyl-CoA mutase [Thermodesulfobacteriota bacterium]